MSIYGTFKLVSSPLLWVVVGMRPVLLTAVATLCLACAVVVAVVWLSCN